MNSLAQDVRYGLRTLSKTPGFTLIAIVTLAVGIGASTAAFSVVNSVLFKPVGYPAPDRIVQIYSANPTLEASRMTVSYPDFIDWRESSESFVDMGIYAREAANFSGGDSPERITMVRATSGLLRALGVDPVIGRAFGPEQDSSGNDRVVLLSDSFWRLRFGADPEIVGQTTLLDGVPIEVLGVLPADLERAWGPFSVWCPLPFDGGVHSRTSRWFDVIGRLEAGVSLAEAQAEVETIAAHLGEEYPESNRGYTVSVEPLLDEVIGRGAKPALSLLVAAAGCVLLIACANVANLLLARATDRQRERAVRAALGAGRWRLARQTLTDSMILAMAGGGLGIVLSIWSLDILAAGLSSTMGRTDEIAMDRGALAFTLLLSVVTAALFGLAPAFKRAGASLTESLKDGSPSSSVGRSRRLWRDLLVMGQIAMALAVVTCAGLMLRSFLALSAVDPGFDISRLLTMRVTLPDRDYDGDEKRVAFIEQVIEKARVLPGVQSVAAASNIPLIGDSSDVRVTIEDREEAGPSERIFVGGVLVTPGYFATMKIPLLRGRAFTRRDSAEGEPVIIVGEKMARRFWPGEEAVGKRLKFGGRDSASPWFTVVGVAGNVRHVRLDRELRFETYVPHTQISDASMSFVVRTAGDPANVAAAVRDAIRGVDPDLAVYAVRPMERIHSENMRARGDMASLLGVFSLIGLILAAVGLYGVVSYNVSQRTHEIGIRVALGARAPDVLRAVLARTALLACCGAAAGIVLALFLGGLLEALLFGVSPSDPATIAAVAAVLLFVALLASYVPARRAIGTDPMAALRRE